MNHLHRPHHHSKETTSDSTPNDSKMRSSSIGYQYQETSQNFPAPEHMKVKAPVEYSDPKAADLARRATEAGRDDLKDMLEHFVHQQEEAKKNYDPALMFQQM
jgi:hypothetical protein